VFGQPARAGSETSAFLAPATEAFILARLAAAEGGGDDVLAPSKKRKTAGGAGGDEAAAVTRTNRTTTPAVLDGTTFSVTVPERGCVRQVKREITKVISNACCRPLMFPLICLYHLLIAKSWLCCSLKARPSR
jgi:hypothetical protein